MSEESKYHSRTSSPGGLTSSLGSSSSSLDSFTVLDSLNRSESPADLNQKQMALTKEGFMEYKDIHKHCRQQLELLKQENKSEMSRMSFQIENLLKQKSGLEEQVQRTKDECRRCLEEQTDLKRKLVERDWERESLGRELSSSKTVIESLRSEKIHLELEIQDLNQNLSTNKNLSTSILTGDTSAHSSEKHPDIRTLMQENENLKQELERFQTENSKQKNEQEALSKSGILQVMKTEKEGLQREISLTKSKLVTVEESYQRSLEKLRALEQQAAGYRDKISSLETQLIRSRVSSTNTNTEETNKEMNSLNTEQNVSEMKEVLQTANKTNNDLEKKLQTLKNEMWKLESQVDCINKQKIDLTTHLGEERDKVLKLEQELALSEGRCIAYEQRIDQFENECRPGSQTTDGHISPTLSSVETKIPELTEQLRKLESQVEKHENMRDNASSVHKKQVSALEEKVRISFEEKEKLNRQIQFQNKKIQELESMLTMCNSEKSEDQNQISVLQSRLVRLDTPHLEHVYEKEVQEIHTTVIKEIEDGSVARLNYMLDLALKKNEKLEFEIRVAQKRVAAVEEVLKEEEFLRATNTELESEIRLYKTRIKSVESRAAVFPDSVAVDELRRTKIAQEVEIENLKKELNILRSNYEELENKNKVAEHQIHKHEDTRRFNYGDSDLKFVELGTKRDVVEWDEFIRDLKSNFESQFASLQNALSASQEHCERLQLEQKHLKQEISRLQNLGSESVTRHDLIVRDRDRMRDEHQSADYKINEIQREKDMLVQQLEQWKNMSRRYRDDGACRDKQIIELRNTVEAITKDMYTKNREVHANKQNILDLKAEIESLQNSLAKAKEDYRVLEEEKKEMEERCRSAFKTSNSVASINTKLEERLIELTNHTSDFETKFNEGRNKEKELQERLNESDEEVSKLRKLCETTSNIKTTQERDLKDLREQMELKRRRNVEMDLTLNENREKEKGLQEKLEVAEVEILKWRELYESAESVKTRQERELKDLEDKVELYVGRDKKIDLTINESFEKEKQLQDKLTTTNAEVLKWKKLCDTVESSKTQQERELKGLREQVNIQTQRIAEIESNLRVSRQQENEKQEKLSAVIVDSSKWKKLYDSTESVKARQECELKGLQEQISLQKRRDNEIGRILNENRQKVTELQQSLTATNMEVLKWKQLYDESTLKSKTRQGSEVKRLEDQIASQKIKTAEIETSLKESRKKEKELQDKLYAANVEVLKWKNLYESTEMTKTKQEHALKELEDQMTLQKRNDAQVYSNFKESLQKANDLQERLTVANTEISKWKKLYETIENATSGQKREFIDLQDQIALKKRNDMETDANLKECRQKETELQEKLIYANAEVSRWKVQWEGANNHRSQLEKEIANRKEQVTELNDGNVSSEYQLRSSNDQKSALELQLTRSTKGKSQLEQHVHHTLEKSRATQEEIKKIHQQLQEYQLLLQKGKEITNSLETTLQHLRIENSELEKQVLLLREELKGAETSLRDALSGKEETDQELYNLKRMLHDYELEQKPSSDTNEIFGTEVATFRAESENQVHCRTLQDKTTSLIESNNKDLREKDVVIADLQHQIKVIKETKEDTNKSKEAISSENYCLTLELHSYKEKASHLESHVDKIVSERDALRTQAIEYQTELKEKEQAIKGFNQEIKKLQDELESSSNELTGKSHQILLRDKQTEFAEKEAVLATIEKRNHELQDQIQALQQKITSLELKQVDPWKMSADTVEETKKDAMINTLETENKKAQDRINTLELNLKEARDTNVSNAEIRTNEDKIRNLEYQIQGLQNAKQNLESQLRQAYIAPVDTPKLQRDEIISNLQLELRKLQKRNSLLEFELNKSRLPTFDNADIKHKDSEISNLKMEKQTLGDRLLWLEKQLLESQTPREDSPRIPVNESQIRSLELENKMLEEKIRTMEIQVSDARKKAEVISKLPLKEARISSLEFENGYLKDRIYTLEMQLVDSRKDGHSLRGQLMNMKSQHELNLSQLSEASLKSEDEKESYQVKLSEKEDRINNLEKQVQVLKEQISSLESKLIHASTQTEKEILLNSLEGQISNLKENNKSLENKLSAACREGDSAIETKLRNLDLENKYLKERNETAAKQRDDDYKELRKKENVIYQLTAEKNALSLKLVEYEQLKRKHELQTENKTQIATLEVDVTMLKEKNKTLEHELCGARREYESTAETKIRNLEFDKKLLRERNETVEKQRDANCKELREKENTIYQLTADKRAFTAKLTDYEGLISKSQEQKKSMENELSGNRRESESTNEARIRNLELDNKYLQERRGTVEAQRDANYRELREKENIISQLTAEKNLHALKLAEYEQLKSKNEEYVKENEKLCKENYSRDYEFYTLKSKISTLESQLKDSSKLNTSFASHDTEKYSKELQEKDAVIKDLQAKVYDFQDEIAKLKLKTAGDNNAEMLREKDDLISYLRNETYALRDEINKIKKQEWPENQSFSDTSKEKDELIEYLRIETYSLRAEIAKLEKEIKKREGSSPSDEESLQLMNEKLCKENKELMGKQAILLIELEMAKDKRPDVEAESNITLWQQKLTEFEDERKKLEAEVQKKIEESAEKDEISKELEKEILALKDENDAYKRMFTEKNDVVGELRHNISDCHREIENLKDKLQSAENTTYTPGEVKAPNKFISLYSINVGERDASPQREISYIEEETRGNNESLLKEPGIYSVSYIYNVDPTVRVRDGSPRSGNITSDGEGDNVTSDNISGKEVEEMRKSTTPTSKAGEKEDILKTDRNGKSSPTAYQNPNYPINPGTLPVNRSGSATILARSFPRCPENSPRYPLIPGRSPRSSPRYPQSPASSPPRSPRSSRTPPKIRVYPVTEVSQTDSKTLEQEDVDLNTTEKSSTPVECQPLHSPLLIDSVESRSPAEDDGAIINKTHIGHNRTPSTSSEISDFTPASDSAHAHDKPRNVWELDQNRSRRYAKFLQRQSFKNRDTATEGSEETLEKQKSRRYSAYREWSL